MQFVSNIEMNERHFWKSYLVFPHFEIRNKKTFYFRHYWNGNQVYASNYFLASKLRFNLCTSKHEEEYSNQNIKHYWLATGNWLRHSSVYSIQFPFSETDIQMRDNDTFRHSYSFQIWNVTSPNDFLPWSLSILSRLGFYLINAFSSSSLFPFQSLLLSTKFGFGCLVNTVWTLLGSPGVWTYAIF